nr:MAG TPA: hypothetical protein [Caudoviricetes sp.]
MVALTLWVVRAFTFDYVSDYLLHLLYCKADNKSSRFSAIQILFIYILHWYHTFL